VAPPSFWLGGGYFSRYAPFCHSRVKRESIFSRVDPVFTTEPVLILRDAGRESGNLKPGRTSGPPAGGCRSPPGAKLWQVCLSLDRNSFIIIGQRLNQYPTFEVSIKAVYLGKSTNFGNSLNHNLLVLRESTTSRSNARLIGSCSRLLCGQPRLKAESNG
jgi:hypothetical protein